MGEQTSGPRHDDSFALAASFTALIPYLAFLVSGVSGLVFQTIWSRLLHHVFGSSSVAISSVVSAFMGGLALGAYLCGRVADRLRRPLFWYALAEGIIGLWALGMPELMRPDGVLAAANSALRANLPLESQGFMLARFLCIVPVLLVPTTLMGATLPLLARHFVTPQGGEASIQTGRLYAVNTLGAVMGVLAAGFWWMPIYGVQATNLIAASMNLSLAAAIGWYALREASAAPALAAPHTKMPKGPAPELDKSPSQIVLNSRQYNYYGRRAAAIGFAGSGVAALAYEVVFARALVNTIGGSVYAFSLILATFLMGIAGGSAYASWTLGTAGGPMLRALVSLCIALSALSALPLWLREGLEAYLAMVGSAVLAVTLFARERRRAHMLAHNSLELLPAFNRGKHPAMGLNASQIIPALFIPTASSALTAALCGDSLSLMLLTTTLTLVTFAAIIISLRTRPLALIVALQLFIGSATFVSSLFTDRLSIAFASVVTPLYDQLPDHVGTVMALMSFMTSLCILPAALAMGAMFPTTMAVFSRGQQSIGRDVSQVYTGNTVGSIVGAWLPGFLLLPILGMQQTLYAGVAWNFALAAFAWLYSHPRWPASPSVATLRQTAARHTLATGMALLIGGGFYYVSTQSPLAKVLSWNISRMTLGAFRISLAKNVLDEENWGAPELLYHRDGLSTTVTVERWGRHVSLKNNGKVEASSGDDMPTQIMVSAYPLLMHPDGPEDKTVAIIGFGSGVTVGAALQFPVRHVTTSELERAVVDASRHFSHVNHIEYPAAYQPIARHSALRVVNDDGRNHLAATDEQYDVIVSEPSNPWLTGVADLFTVEHFRVSKRRLKPGGVYCQWVQLYEMSPENVKIIYRTFASHFKYVLAFSAEERSSDTILLGSDRPLAFDLERIRKTVALPKVSAELARAYVHSPQDMIARLLFSSREEVMRYAQVEERLVGQRWQPQPANTNHMPCPEATCRRSAVPLNTDDNALIEFAAPKDLIGFERYRGYLRSMYAADWPYGHAVQHLRLPPEASAAQRELAQLALSQLAHGRMNRAKSALKRAARLNAPQSAELQQAKQLVSLMQLPWSEHGPDFVAPRTGDLGAPLRRALLTSVQEARDLGAEGKYPEAYSALRTIPGPLRQHAGPDTQFMFAYYALVSGHPEQAVEALEPLIQLEPDFVRAAPEVFYVLARAQYERHHFASGVQLMRAYAGAMP